MVIVNSVSLLTGIIFMMIELLIANEEKEDKIVALMIMMMIMITMVAEPVKIPREKEVFFIQSFLPY